MINFFSETDFQLPNQDVYFSWITQIIKEEKFILGDINYVFCDDELLHKINLEYLQHDTLTDIISFDYSVGKQLHGEIYISIERIKDNAQKFKVSFENELLRVMIHGILHFMGYKDKSPEEQQQMRQKENEAILKFSL
ncbi:MAG: rRNA maturation RNase YbeY [Flavobacteriaceae bacterium]|nr:rRNA maturation RNase YbeY [Flavobacteriaceae bacterium]